VPGKRFLSQPFFVAEVFTGSWKCVKAGRNAQGLPNDLSGELDALPEQAFYMVGNIDEAIPKSKKLKAKASFLSSLLTKRMSLTVRVVSQTKLFGMPPLKKLSPVRLVWCSHGHAPLLWILP